MKEREWNINITPELLNEEKAYAKTKKREGREREKEKLMKETREEMITKLMKGFFPGRSVRADVRILHQGSIIAQ